ncbi:LexA family protein [Leucobacter sp. M11]|uniref:LexA family protein n=1 Tax=Leucobacter sp. M11 TaxID=2993565 RepID=UPI002D7E866B|nr:translesion error-prone DNA polymerase V autoproteolytic subunit [Leucobacter sp. M11]MEB4616094.1 translesion error-prone DNA polymerase V autoproteolytic subunit [Leucobacter sp. M11]
MIVSQQYVLRSRTPLVAVPVAQEAVQAGFPSPSQDYYDGEIDLNELLIHDRTATFLLRVSGHSMVGAGIHDGDHVILDRSLAPQDGDVVVAVLDGELTLKRLQILSGGVVLRAENPRYPDIRVAELSELRLLGVVTECLRHLRKRAA